MSMDLPHLLLNTCITFCINLKACMDTKNYLRCIKSYSVEQHLLIYAQNTNITDNWPLTGANFKPITATVDL